MKNKSNSELLTLQKKIEKEYKDVQSKIGTLYEHMVKLSTKYNEITEELNKRSGEV